MKGAIAELCASKISAPNRNRITSIGRSHQRLLLPKKEKSSPATPKLRMVLRTRFMFLYFREQSLEISRKRHNDASALNSLKNVDVAHRRHNQN
jgi:hypothetical protein